MFFHHLAEIGLVKDSLIKQKTRGIDSIAARTNVMECLADQPGIAAGAFLEGQGWIKSVSLSARAPAYSRHLQILVALGTPKEAQYDTKIEFLGFFCKPNDLRLNLIELEQ
jgi:hypothetical protein